MAVLRSEPAEVFLPTAGKRQDRTARLDSDSNGYAVRVGESWKDRERRRAVAKPTQIPVTLVMVQERVPRLLLTPPLNNQVQVVGNVSSPHDLPDFTRIWSGVERENGNELTGGVCQPMEAKPAAMTERVPPTGLPLPGQEERQGGRAGEQSVPLALGE
jgi:hypothetical protein